MSRKSARVSQKSAIQAASTSSTSVIRAGSPSSMKGTAQAGPASSTSVAAHVGPQVSEAHGHGREVARVRGGVLTTWLVLVLVLNSLSICFAGISLVLDSLSHQPLSLSWSILAALIICPLALVSTAGIFRWKKWGFYAFLIVAGCGFVLDILLGQFVVVSHAVSLTHPGISTTSAQIYITWPLAAGLMWLLVHSKKRWPMFH